MTNPMGELTVTVGGKEYNLRLTMRSIAVLQQEYGQELAPVLGLAPGALPDFGVCLRVVDLALRKHHPDLEGDVADDILTQDMTIFGRLIQAAFPQPEPARPGKPRAAR